ncbi:MAG: thioredoxin family protein [Betaproteobacteria bacterium]|nr:thioredoxin family protein [Betaproteobacteria bacterium]
MSTHLTKQLLAIVKTAVIGAALLQFTPLLAAGKDGDKHAQAGGVAWIAGESETVVDAAFAQARLAAKPVLLYWGATWCPPCNQLKATLFNRRDFIALTRAVVPVYLDGDLPGAQKLGSRFKVVGYPTLILFSPDGAEITRLPGEVDANRITASLQAGLAGGRPAKAVLADAQAGRALSASEWLALAFYSWDTDEAQLVTREQRAAVLNDLAQRSQAISPEASTRLWLKSLEAQASSPADGRAPTLPDQRERLLEILRNPDATRLHADILIESAKPIVLALNATADTGRAGLVDEYIAALLRLQHDHRLSRADRTGALTARVDLARLGLADDAVRVSLPKPLLVEVKAMARRMDTEISNAYERQAVITNVAHLLGEAGLWAESDALLRANLKKSHSPYYLMSQLGGNARKLGRTTEALSWYQRAYQASRGPATRLQWGASYVAALVDLAPQDHVRIEKAAMSLFADAAQDKAAFYERSSRSLKRAIDKLTFWNTAGEHTATIARLRVRYAEVCEGIAAADPQRTLCVALWPIT